MTPHYFLIWKVKLNILYLAHRIPYPPNKGDKIRSFHQIIHLSHKHNIFLISTLDDPEEEKHIESLKPHCTDIFAVYFNRKARLFSQLYQEKPFSILSFYDFRIQTQVDTILSNTNIDAIIVFCSSMAQYVIHSKSYKKGQLRDVRLILDFVDMDSDKWRQYAQYSNFPMNLVYWLENHRLLKYEVMLNSIFDYSVFSSDCEVKTFKAHHPDAQSVMTIPNGVDYDYFSLKENAPAGVFNFPKNGPRILFTGVMDYFANEDGVIWFCEKIFPQIRQKIPSVEFYIVGNRPTDVVWALSEHDGVTVTGFVPDIRPYYWLADVCVVPLRIARGLQNKILEAMATGNAVVATSNASNGIICSNGEDIIIVDNEKHFALEVVNLLQNEPVQRRLAHNARKNIIKNYSWQNNMEKLDNLLEGKVA